MAVVGMSSVNRRNARIPGVTVRLGAARWDSLRPCCPFARAIALRQLCSSSPVRSDTSRSANPAIAAGIADRQRGCEIFVPLQRMSEVRPSVLAIAHQPYVGRPYTSEDPEPASKEESARLAARRHCSIAAPVRSSTLPSCPMNTNCHEGLDERDIANQRKEIHFSVSEPTYQCAVAEWRRGLRAAAGADLEQGGIDSVEHTKTGLLVFFCRALRAGSDDVITRLHRSSKRCSWAFLLVDQSNIS